MPTDPQVITKVLCIIGLLKDQKKRRELLKDYSCVYVLTLNCIAISYWFIVSPSDEYDGIEQNVNTSCVRLFPALFMT